MKKHQEAAATEKAAPEPLTNLVFTCVSTGKPVEYEVPGDVGTLRELWARELNLTCPHCGEVHRFSFRAAFIEGALARASFEAVLGR